MKQGGARSRGLGLALVRGGVLVPWGWGGGLGSILRHRKGDRDPPPSPSSRGRTTARRTRLPLLDPLAASLLASYHSKGGFRGTSPPRPQRELGYLTGRRGPVQYHGQGPRHATAFPLSRSSCWRAQLHPASAAGGVSPPCCSHRALQGTFTPNPHGGGG